MKRCNECSKQYSQMNKNPEGGCTPPVIQINNDPGCVLFHKVVFPASIGDDTTNPPSEFIGKYKNVLLVYEANNRSYMFSSDGMYTQLNNGVTDYEEATNLPQINGNTLIGDKTGAELGLQNELTAGANIQIDSDNVISATDTTYGPATDEAIGLVKPGDGLSIQADGTLDITDIEEYAHFFDTVADMQSAENLVDGSKAKTYGYLRKGDGVYDIYTVREITNEDVVDGYNIVALVNTEDLIAERLQYGKSLVINLNTTDDIQSYMNLEGAKTIVLPKGEDISVEDALIINSDTTIELNGATLTFDYARPASFPAVNWDETLGFMSYSPSSDFTGYDGFKNITIKNGTIKGGCSCFLHSQNVTIKNVVFADLGARHAMQFGACYGVTVDGCTFNGTRHESGVEHSSECINIDPANYGGQPFVSSGSAMFDHTANKCIVIKNNIFKNATSADQLYACGVGSHGADDNGQQICESFTVENNDFGSPYSDAINICDYKNVYIHDNTAIFSTSSHDTLTYFVHGRGGLENVNVNNNIARNMSQFMYTDSAQRTRKTLLINGNTIYTKDTSGYRSIQLSHYEDVFIQYNNISTKYGAIHTDGLYTGSTYITDTNCTNVNIEHNDIWVVDGGGGEIQIRIKYTAGVKINANTIYCTSANNVTWGYIIALQDGVTDAIVSMNDTSSQRTLIDPTSVTSKFAYNHATYTLSNASGTSTSGTLNIDLTYLTKITMQLGETANTQRFEILPWLGHNRNKFYWDTSDTSRTWKFAVVKNDGTLGTAVLVINRDNTFSYTGDIALKNLRGMD